MPELPEAETIVRDLRPRLTGARVLGARVRHPDVLEPPLTARRLANRLRGRRISGVSRRGKNIILEIEDGIRLAVNLGMSGRVVTSDAARAAELRHVAVTLPLEDGRSILYDDARRFGRLTLHTPESWRIRDAALGVEPLSDQFTAERLHALTRASTVPVRNWLLDQRRVAGVGNIYANEALFLAGVRPTRRARTLTRAETARLRDALRDVLARAIRARGTTFSLYRDASGEEGGFYPALAVYDHAGEPCPRCGSPIKRIVLTNRSAFYCPACQR